jgi:hypothetical protein
MNGSSATLPPGDSMRVRSGMDAAVEWWNGGGKICKHERKPEGKTDDAV